jgi:predicted O-linked N-acetylglucosamine transferase (SPINDLY family)
MGNDQPDRVAEGVALYAQGRLAEAEALLRAAVDAATGSFAAYHHLAAITAARGAYEEAEAWQRRAVALDGRHPNALANLGAILRARQKPAEALAAYEAALAVSPRDPAVLSNRANLLNDLKRWREALESADAALAAAPDAAVAHNARGNALTGLGRRAEALAAYEAALREAPDYFAALFNRAKALLDGGDAGGALSVYEAALAVQPGSADALAGRGHAMATLKRWGEAAAAYEAAHRLNPDLPFVAGHRLHARMKICDWRDFDALVTDLGARIDAGRPAGVPFPLGATPLSASQQLACARTYVGAFFAPAPRPAAAAPGPRIRLGYFSADLHEHATAHLIAEMVELHDRSRFEVTAFSYGPASDGPMRQRLLNGFERFQDVRRLGADAICAAARDAGIDIAIDLKGFTTDARPEIFALGAAPVQVSFLGYPMTTGAPFMDYLIADRVLVGPQETGLYSEALAWLPACYQPTDRRRTMAMEATTRADHGLPRGAFVFASFNASYKITPEVFATWMRLLQAVGGSVLWLLGDDPAAAENLRAAARAAGVDAARLVFAPFHPQAQHLERLGHADLFVDTYPYTAHTTASDALWAGLPLLTRRGETFASRVAASILTAAGLPELVTLDAKAYEALALALARDPDRLAGLRRRAAAAKETAALFDTPTFVRALEHLYLRMHERRLAGLPPTDLS